MATWPLSAPTYPRIEGRDDFKGEAYHTGLWPKHPVTFEGKRVAVIGAGIVGPHAGDLIAECVLAIEMGCEAGDIGLSIHPHPTLSETVAM